VYLGFEKNELYRWRSDHFIAEADNINRAHVEKIRKVKKILKPDNQSSLKTTVANNYG
jgi:hypothetical protein